MAKLKERAAAWWGRIQLDEQDQWLLEAYRIEMSRNPYGYEHVKCVDRATLKVVSIARAIMKPGEDEVVDHINGDTLDNRRSNLRVCTRRQNAQNRGPSNGREGFKGVRKYFKLSV